MNGEVQHSRRGVLRDFVNGLTQYSSSRTIQV